MTFKILELANLQRIICYRQAFAQGLKPADGDSVACFAGKESEYQGAEHLTRQPQSINLTKSQPESRALPCIVYDGISERLSERAPDLTAGDKATFSLARCCFRGHGEGTLILLTVGYSLQTDWLIPASVTLSHLLYQESSPCISHPSPRAVCTAQLNPPPPVCASSLPMAATVLGVFVVLCSAQSLIVNLGSLIFSVPLNPSP